MGNTNNVLQSPTITLNIAETILELDGARVTEIAEHLDLSKSSVFNHLMTLKKKTMFQRTGTSIISG